MSAKLKAVVTFLFISFSAKAWAFIEPGFHREYLKCHGSAVSNIYLKHASARCKWGSRAFEMDVEGRGATGGIAIHLGYVIATIADGAPIDSIVGTYHGVEFGLSAVIGGHVGIFGRVGDPHPLYIFGLLVGGLGDLSNTTISMTPVSL